MKLVPESTTPTSPDPPDPEDRGKVVEFPSDAQCLRDFADMIDRGEVRTWAIVMDGALPDGTLGYNCAWDLGDGGRFSSMLGLIDILKHRIMKRLDTNSIAEED